MTNPTLLRALMALVALACFAAAHFFPSQADALVPVGVGFLGWATPAPGHGSSGGTGNGAAIGLICAAMFVPSATACAEVQHVNPRTAAVKAIQNAAKLCDAYRLAVAAGDVPHDKYVDDGCSLVLAPTVEPGADSAPPQGGAGAQ